MINFLIIIQIHFMMILQFDHKTITKWVDKIDPSWHVYLATYYIDAIKFITVPVHDDAIDIILENFKLEQTASMLYVWNDKICGKVIHYNVTYMSYYRHLLYKKHTIQSDEFITGLITTFPDAVEYIGGLTDEHQEIHNFAHKL